MNNQLNIEQKAKLRLKLKLRVLVWILKKLSVAYLDMYEDEIVGCKDWDRKFNELTLDISYKIT